MQRQMWLVERGVSNFDKHRDPTSIEASKSWKPKGQYSFSLQVTLYGCCVLSYAKDLKRQI